MKKKDEVIQIIISRLNPGVKRKTYIATVKKMKQWLSEREGFVSYELYEGEDSFADRIVWKDLKGAMEGNQAFLKTDIYKQIEKMTDPNFHGILGKKVAL